MTEASAAGPDVPQGTLAEARGRGRADRGTTTAPSWTRCGQPATSGEWGGCSSTWRASSGSATGSTGPSTTRTRRAVVSRIGSIYLTGEIIHNPRVNDRLRDAGIRFLSDAGEDEHCARAGRRRHPPPPSASPSRCCWVSSSRAAPWSTRRAGPSSTSGRTCASNARDGFTAIIHGKAKHEETVRHLFPGPAVPRTGRSLVVLESRRDRDRLRLHPARRRRLRVPVEVRGRRVARLRPPPGPSGASASPTRPRC